MFLRLDALRSGWVIFALIYRVPTHFLLSLDFESRAAAYDAGRSQLNIRVLSTFYWKGRSKSDWRDLCSIAVWSGVAVRRSGRGLLRAGRAAGAMDRRREHLIGRADVPVMRGRIF